MHEFSLKCFGVGDGWPSPARNHSSYLYRFGGQALLIDCGEPISGTYKASGLSYDLIDRILLSHLHFDHVGGFFMLVQGLWLEGRKKPLPVHLPADGIEPIQQLFRAGCIFDELFKFRLSYVPLQTHEVICSDGVEITPFPTSHLKWFRTTFQTQHPQRYEAFSFLMATDRLRIAHSGDIGAPDDLDPLLAEPVDLLVCELAHVDPDELFAFLSRRKIKRIWFVHVNQKWEPRVDEIKARAGRILGADRLQWLVDGQELNF